MNEEMKLLQENLKKKGIELSDEQILELNVSDIARYAAMLNMKIFELFEKK